MIDRLLQMMMLLKLYDCVCSICTPQKGQQRAFCIHTAQAPARRYNPLPDPKVYRLPCIDGPPSVFRAAGEVPLGLP